MGTHPDDRADRAQVAMKSVIGALRPLNEAERGRVISGVSAFYNILPGPDDVPNLLAVGNNRISMK